MFFVIVGQKWHLVSDMSLPLRLHAKNDFFQFSFRECKTLSCSDNWFYRLFESVYVKRSGVGFSQLLTFLVFILGWWWWIWCYLHEVRILFVGLLLLKKSRKIKCFGWNECNDSFSSVWGNFVCLFVCQYSSLCSSTAAATATTTTTTTAAATSSTISWQLPAVAHRK